MVLHFLREYRIEKLLYFKQHNFNPLFLNPKFKQPIFGTKFSRFLFPGFLGVFFAGDVKYNQDIFKSDFPLFWANKIQQKSIFSTWVTTEPTSRKKPVILISYKYRGYIGAQCRLTTEIFQWKARKIIQAMVCLPIRFFKSLGNLMNRFPKKQKRNVFLLILASSENDLQHVQTKYIAFLTKVILDQIQLS